MIRVFVHLLLLLILTQASSGPAAKASQPAELVIIENSEVRVGIDPSAGGAIAWISAANAKRSLVNSYDRGRLLQQSYYGRVDGSQWNGKPWRWNPVQGGEWRGEGSKVLTIESAENSLGQPTLTVRAVPRNWGGGELLEECEMRQTITLDGPLIQLDFEFIYRGDAEHPEHDQEIPALFVDPSYATLVTYSGDQPWTDDAVESSVPGWPNESRKLAESWAAYVNDQGEGIGIYVPVAQHLTCYRYGNGRSRDSCSYLAPLTRFAIVPGFEWKYRAWVSLGSVEQLRSRFSQVRDQQRDNEERPDSQHEADQQELDQSAIPEGSFTELTLPSPAPMFSSDPEQALRDYLATEFDAAITSVVVQEQTIRIRGVSPVVKNRVVLEWPMEIGVEQAFATDASGSSDDDAALQSAPWYLDVLELELDAHGRFEIEVPRFVARNDSSLRDRLYSKWCIGQRIVNNADDSVEGSSYVSVSHARAFDAVEPRATLSWPTLRGRKGLGAWGPGRPIEDLDDLGVSGVTVNILLDTFISAMPREGWSEFQSQGAVWYRNDSALKQLDQSLLEAARRDLLVSVIILIRQSSACVDRVWGNAVAHPDANAEGIFVMPNVESSEGIRAYVAALELLAERYTRVDGEFGRIHHWIMHNEVNSGWVWTNAGTQSALGYTQLLYRSLRLTHAVIRRYDAKSQVFVSLDHHWTSRHNERCFGARSILEWFTVLGKREGDFEWAIAHHPYPQDLFEPRTWLDDHAIDSLDTEKITYRNLEVLDRWAAQPSHWFRDLGPRKIHLTEQGLNSRSYSAEDLRNQAAGMAYVWHKLKRLDTIELFHYHNWVDNRHEGGLRIGLRRFPDDEQEPHGKKPIWFVYQALETEREAEATEFALPVIGIKQWTELK